VGKTPKNVQKHVIKKSVKMFSDICLRYTQGHVLAKLHEMALMPFYLSKVNLLIHSAADFIGLSLYNKILS